jgi:hypothetical protein
MSYRPVCMFLFSIGNTVLIGLMDAIIKGNIVASYKNWARVPWYFKDENFIYPGLVFVIFLLSAFAVRKIFNFSRHYFLFLLIWAVGGLESVSYWFWIKILNIPQGPWWEPSASVFSWYPKEAPWLDIFFHLKALSNAEHVTREAVMIGIVGTIVLNVLLTIVLIAKRTRDGTSA